jgi:hypothetical protein
VPDAGYPERMSTHDDKAPKRNGAVGVERGGRTVAEWNRIDRGEAEADPLDKTDTTVASTEPPD